MHMHDGSSHPELSNKTQSPSCPPLREVASATKKQQAARQRLLTEAEVKGAEGMRTCLMDLLVPLDLWFKVGLQPQRG